MGKVEIIGDETFAQAVEDSKGIVVVDFMTTWCPPCKMLAPILERVAEKMEGQVRIYKCDTDEYADLSMRYGVTKIPNVTIFKDGQVVDQSVGYLSEDQLTGKIKAQL